MNFFSARHLMLPAAQRAAGRLDLAFSAAGGGTRIKTFYQQGCLKARLPRPAEAETCEAVTLNISGGVAGGDALETAISLDDGARVCVSSQAAERIYLALDADPATIATRINLGAGARLDYLPQETILFDGFALRRTLEIDLAADASFLGVESLVFGRQAMGERVTTGFLRDCITLRRDGVLVLRDMTRLDGDIEAVLARKAVAGGRIAMAALIYAAPDAPACLDDVRSMLAAQKCPAGASVLDGVLRARIVAPSASALRTCLIAALKICRNGRPLPRTWQT
jgi:urease accessory protein